MSEFFDPQDYVYKYTDNPDVVEVAFDDVPLCWFEFSLQYDVEGVVTSRPFIEADIWGKFYLSDMKYYNPVDYGYVT